MNSTVIISILFQAIIYSRLGHQFGLRYLYTIHLQLAHFSGNPRTLENVVL